MSQYKIRTKIGAKMLPQRKKPLHNFYTLTTKNLTLTGNASYIRLAKNRVKESASPSQFYGPNNDH